MGALCTLILGIVLILMGVGGFWVAYREHRLISQLKAIGVQTEAIIVNHWSLERSGGSATYSVTFRFDLGTTSYVRKQSVSRTNYNALEIGICTPITYLANDPQQTARLDGAFADRTRFHSAVIAGIAFTLLGLAFVLVRIG